MQPVLLCYDGSADSRHAIASAGGFLRGQRAVVLHVVPTAVDSGLGPRFVQNLDISPLDDQVLARAEATLTEGLRLAESVGFQATGLLKRARHSIWQVILQSAEECHPGVIVLGSHGQRLRNHLSLGNVACGLVSQSRFPLLVTHGNDVSLSRTEGEGNAARMLLAFDGSETSVSALHVASKLFPKLDARILCAWETAGYWDRAADSGSGEQMQNKEPQMQAAAQLLAKQGAELAARWGVRAAPLPVPAPNGIGRAIVSTVRDLGLDLVVVGSHGHSRAARSLAGTTAQYVIQHADRPVLFVPELELSERSHEFDVIEAS